MISTSFTKEEWEVCLFSFQNSKYKYPQWRFIVDIYPTFSYYRFGRLGNTVWVGNFCFRGTWFAKRNND